MNTGRRLADTEVLTVRVADVREGDMVELPDLVWVWNKWDKWVGRRTRNELRLTYPHWHLVYDVLEDGDDDLAKEMEVFECRHGLHEHYLMFRIAAEQPNDPDYPDTFLALHEFDLVRVQRAVRPEAVPSEAAATVGGS